MVALSHAHRARAGLRRPPDESKPFVEVSGRKGLGVKADDLLDRADRQGARRGRARATRSCRADETPRTAETIGDRRGALLPGQVLAHQGDRVRHRRGAELRGRERAVPAVRRGARQQHLQKLQRARRPRRGRRCAATLRRRPPTPLDRRGRRRRCGPWCSKRRGSTKSSSRWCGRSNSSVLAKYAFGLAQAFNAVLSHASRSSTRSASDVRRWRAAAISLLTAGS